MSKLLQFVSIWEFLLRYTVIVGVVIAVLGVACCFTARMFNKKDGGNNGHSTLIITGIVLILLGMIIMVLPIEATLYRG